MSQAGSSATAAPLMISTTQPRFENKELKSIVIEEPTAEKRRQIAQAATDVQAVAVLIDDLRSVDTITRVNSIKSLRVIAAALGPERVRKELVPYLTEFVDDDDDVLIVLAAELGVLGEYVGGAEHVYVLLEPLEALAAAEDLRVRETAIAALAKVVGELVPDALRHAMQMFRRLVCSEWYTARISSCALVPTLYTRVVEPQRKELRSVITQLCNDEMPMVRRAVCANLPRLVPLLDDATVMSELLPAYLKLTRDDQDSVRLLLVDPCISFAEVCRRQGQAAQVMPVVLGLCTDKSWRVRFMAADRFKSICDAVGEADLKSDELAESFVRLLADPEAEVRVSAAGRVGAVAKALGPEKTVRILMTPLARVVHDTNQHARVALAEDIVSLAVVLSKPQVTEKLIPLLLQLLKDSHPDVRLNLIARLDVLQPVIGVEALSHALMPAICQLALDKNWRVRYAVIERVPKVAQLLGAAFYEDRLSNLCMSWIGDQVAAVRDRATTNLSVLSTVFGPAWAVANLIPKLKALASRKSYLYRMTCLSTCLDLCPILGRDGATQNLVPIVLSLLSDPVPNVRFHLSKVLGLMAPQLPADTTRKLILPALDRLSGDADSDVAYFAMQSVKAVNDTLAGGTTTAAGGGTGAAAGSVSPNGARQS